MTPRNREYFEQTPVPTNTQPMHLHCWPFPSTQNEPASFQIRCNPKEIKHLSNMIQQLPFLNLRQSPFQGYYLSFQQHEFYLLQEVAIAGSYWKGVLFPLGYIGFGMKLAVCVLR